MSKNKFEIKDEIKKLQELLKFTTFELKPTKDMVSVQWSVQQ